MNDKVWFITGASRGFGALIAKAALARGDAVVATARNAAAVADALGPHPQLLALPLDVTHEAQAHAAAARAIERFGRIDVLVNNAAINRDTTMRKMTDEQFAEVVDTNLVGTHRVTKAVLDPMCEQGFGRIVTISSFVGQLGNYGQANYAATKGGLIAWTKTLAYEVARFGVTVNCVCPGFIDTDMLRGVPEHVLEKLLARVPLGRFGEADEIARGVLYLVRDGEYVTGTCLNINGGLYM